MNRIHRFWLSMTPTSIFGMSIVLAISLLAIGGPLLAPYRVGEIVSMQSFAPPSVSFPLGTDVLGRDVLSRILHGGLMTIAAAVAATVVGFLLGVGTGFAAAVTRGRFDTLVTWIIDVFLSFPPVLFALIVIAGIGSSFISLVGVVAIIQSVRIARVARALALNISTLEHVQVARARGEGLYYILTEEIWPNTARPLSAEFGLRLTFSLLFMSSLSFIGLGIQPPHADWGSMVRENMAGLYYGAIASFLPAALIAFLTLGISFTVDWLASKSGRNISRELIS